MTTAIDVPVIKEHESIVTLEEKRARLQERLEQLQATYQARRGMRDFNQDLSPSELAESYPLAAVRLEERLEEHRKRKARDPWSGGQAPSMDEESAVLYELKRIPWALSEIDRALYQTRTGLVSSIGRTVERSAPFRDLALAFACEVSGRNKAALDFLEATAAARQGGVKIVGLPQSVWREIEELIEWLALLQHLGVLEARQVEALHTYLQARLAKQ